jgi:hypothetical protein
VIALLTAVVATLRMVTQPPIPSATMTSNQNHTRL